MTREVIGLDFETYAATSLPNHGLERYVTCPTFRPLIASVDAMWSSGGGVDYDLVLDPGAESALLERVADAIIVAHNAPFEQRVLKAMGLDLPAERFIDSAVIARAMGAGGKLEAAAPQLLGVDKMEEGSSLIRLFSIPSKQAREEGRLHFDIQVVYDNYEKWDTFRKYCRLDAHLGRRIWESYGSRLPAVEQENQAITMRMNQTGWPVDVRCVEEMHRRYEENLVLLESNFRTVTGATDLNINSYPQLKKFALDRGIRANSFDEEHVKSLLARLEKRMASMDEADKKFAGYWEVRELLLLKQEMGGSSLKKLKVILDTVSHEGRLHDQYLHIGAGQTYRTSGRSVQMQNLKRLTQPRDLSELFFDDPESESEWTNEELASNIRQVFTSSDPDGLLIVGDFSSVESRGLAWWAGEQWKLEAYRRGVDMYKTLAARIDCTTIDQVTKDRRQFGKVGELSCGYQAGPGAVQSFAKKMGTELTEGEAGQLVTDWRDSNPAIVKWWADLHTLLEEAMVTGASTLHTWTGFEITAEACNTPSSLVRQHPKARTLEVAVRDTRRELVFSRFFHGVYRRGKDLVYYKPSERKTGDLWRDRYTDPKTKQLRFHTIYGGKLAGILTQSLCREIFFQSLRQVNDWLMGVSNVDLIGQFHDEIVLDWRPSSDARAVSCSEAMEYLEVAMSSSGQFLRFPLAAEVKSDYRYTK